MLALPLLKRCEELALVLSARLGASGLRGLIERFEHAGSDGIAIVVLAELDRPELEGELLAADQVALLGDGCDVCLGPLGDLDLARSALQIKVRKYLIYRVIWLPGLESNQRPTD